MPHQTIEYDSGPVYLSINQSSDTPKNDSEHIVSDELPTIPKAKLVTILISLMLAVFMAASNESMVTTALSGITTSLHSSGDVTWITAAYLLMSTASQPLYGKLSDIFGRKNSLLFATIIFILGSLGCCFSPNLPTLAFFRGLDGIGAGGLTSLGYIVISDLVPLRRRGSLMSFLQLTFAFAGVVGPILGGFLVDYYSWRMVFFITVPMGFILLISLYWLPPQPTSNLTSKIKRVDFKGTVTLVFGTICIILGCNWGGKEYSWGSWPVILSFVVGSIFFCLFVLVEYSAEEPLFPLHTFNRNTIICTIITLAFGFSLFTMSTFLPIYHIYIQNRSATYTGILTIPLYLGTALTAALTGFLVDKYGRHAFLMRLGMFVLIIGECLGFLFRPGVSVYEELIVTALLGIGIGLNLQLVILVSQASNLQKDIAVVTAFQRYALALGGTLGIAIYGSIFNNYLRSYLTNLLPTYPELSEVLASSSDILSALSSFSNQELSHQALLSSFHTLLLALIPTSLIGFISSLFLQSTESLMTI